MVVLVDLPCFGRPCRLRWRKYRWCCTSNDCGVGSWTEQAPLIGSPRLAMTDRAGRWVTEQVGRCGRTVNEIATELATDWHTINDTVIAYGTALVEDPERVGEVTALGLDETLFFREGQWRTQRWCTSIVDVAAGGLLDVVEGCSATKPCEWLAEQGQEWLDDIRWAALDLSAPTGWCSTQWSRPRPRSPIRSIS